VSAELDEILSLSDRIAVMYRGKIVGILDSSLATAELLGYMMATGQTPDAPDVVVESTA
jgi:simple sugar transport system ATP-binding protein